MKTKISATMIVASIAIFLAILYSYYSMEGFQAAPIKCTMKAEGTPGTPDYVPIKRCKHPGFCDPKTNTCKIKVRASTDYCMKDSQCKKKYEKCSMHRMCLVNGRFHETNVDQESS